MTRYAAIALILLATSPAGAAERSFERTFDVSPGGTLIVDADSASVRVSAADTPRVSVRMTARGSEEALAGAKLDAFQKGADVTVVMKLREKGNWFGQMFGNREGHVQITVPKRFAINVHTSGGNVELTGTEGAVTLNTSGGSITAKNVTGNVRARTSGGGILADTIRGDVDANTSGGDVRLLHIDGKISGRTSGGSVQCSLVGLNRGITATTSGGSIELTLPRSTAASLEATTSGGDISSELPVAGTRQDDGHLKGSINGGGNRIEARTSGGDISLSAAN
jgi:DUF4097 and DUF4098 domain-containing protein YvlB